MNEKDDLTVATSHETLNVPVQSPFCGELRSKKFFMFDGIATDASEYLDASNHCWCRKTQQVIGPDGGRVHPNLCGPGRECYISGLERA